MGLHEKHKAWIDSRGLSVELAEKLGLTTVRREGKAWLSVPYVQRGETVNHKYRLTSEKRHMMDSGGKLILWNHDCLLDEEDKRPVVICEGEWDAIAAMMAGFRAVSVPNGASSADGDFDYLWDARDLLNRIDSFILAADGDDAGKKLRAGLEVHLGKDRCRFVEYPDHCKDLNDVLELSGLEAVAECLQRAKAVPVQGLYRLDQFPERGELEAWPMPIPALLDLMAIVPGTVTVLTGFPNMGKSTVMDNIIAGVMKQGRNVCLASFETDIKPILHEAMLCSLLECQRIDLDHRDLSAANALLDKRLRIITQTVETDDEDMDLNRFLSLCAVAVKQHGCRMVVVDPWNELEHKKDHGETETEYTGRALRAFRRFAKINNVAVWIVAHPSKPFEGKVRMPRLLDISGSANWANKPDYGLSYHRSDPEKNEGELCVTKVRKGYPGKRGTVKVWFNFQKSRFEELAA